MNLNLFFMKQTVRLFAVALFAGAITLGGYKYFIESESIIITPQQESPSFIPTNFSSESNLASIDLTEAAEKTVHAVVHVKNTTVTKQPTNIIEYYSGGGKPRATIGSGSGVIISPDGLIITNNHHN